MVITMNDYRKIREYWLNGMSQRRIARELGISRNTVKKYCEGGSVPWKRKDYTRAPTVVTEEVRDFVAACLKEDEVHQRSKQHHTAKRIYDRLVEESGFVGGESTIRRYVREQKGKAKEAFVPLEFSAGEAMQIDWGESTIYLNGVRRSIYLFCARLCSSGAPIVYAYRRQNSESFLDALVRCFEYFGGVPRRVIFDNARVAVKKGFGVNAKPTDSYTALASHYGFTPVFCNIASGNEKGLVEGLVGFSRRNFLVPVPRVESMDTLNMMLEKHCKEYLTHTIQGRHGTVGEYFMEEKKAIYPLPLCRYDAARRAECTVTAYSTVRFDTNNYSVPVEYCGKPVSIRGCPERVEIYYEGKKIAVHQRCFHHQENIYRMEHYLPLLERKGRAIFQAKPVRDNVPKYFLEWLRRQNLTPRELVNRLRLSLKLGVEAVMQGQTDEMEVSAPKIMDVVQVVAVDLNAYDGLCRSAKVVSA